MYQFQFIISWINLSSLFKAQETTNKYYVSYADNEAAGELDLHHLFRLSGAGDTFTPRLACRICRSQFSVSLGVLISTFRLQCCTCTATRELIYGVAYYSVFISIIRLHVPKIVEFFVIPRSFEIWWENGTFCALKWAKTSFRCMLSTISGIKLH